MEPTIDEAEVRHLAKLACLSVDDDEVMRLSSQLGRVLAHFRKLSEVDTDGVPKARPDAVQIGALRADQVTLSVSHEDALASTADQSDGLFRVSKVFDPS